MNALDQARGLDLLKGEATFTGPKRLLVQDSDWGATEISAERLFINAGARPARPGLDGLKWL